MKKTNLLKEAIADAKSLKETAIANAKLALEESFAPRIKEMVSNKLQEMEDELDENSGSELEEIVDENYNEDGNLESSPMDEEFDLDEILAELENEENTSELEEISDDDENLDEEIDLEAILAEVEDEDKSKDKETKPKKKTSDTTSKDKKDNKSEKKDEDEDEEDEEVGEMTIDELKDLIRSIIAGEDETEDENQIMGDIDAIGDMDKNKSKTPEFSLDEASDPQLNSAIKGAQELSKMFDKDFFKALKDDVKSDLKSKLEYINKVLSNIGSAAGSAMRSENTNEFSELEELRQELNETNLLNSKLLYSNRLFKEFTLNENQKLRIINAFDKANTAKEAKLIYETIKGSFTIDKNKSKKNSIKESLGFASKPIKTIKENNDNNIVDNDLVNRFQKLAGIIK